MPIEFTDRATGRRVVIPIAPGPPTSASFAGSPEPAYMNPPKRAVVGLADSGVGAQDKRPARFFAMIGDQVVELGEGKGFHAVLVADAIKVGTQEQAQGIEDAPSMSPEQIVAMSRGTPDEQVRAAIARVAQMSRTNDADDTDAIRRRARATAAARNGASPARVKELLSMTSTGSAVLADEAAAIRQRAAATARARAGK